jgi:hypothetical protein
VGEWEQGTVVAAAGALVAGAGADAGALAFAAVEAARRRTDHNDNACDLDATACVALRLTKGSGAAVAAAGGGGSGGTDCAPARAGTALADVDRVVAVLDKRGTMVGGVSVVVCYMVVQDLAAGAGIGSLGVIVVGKFAMAGEGACTVVVGRWAIV